MLDSKMVQCPYCGESFKTVVEVAAGTSEYVEDCQVCCRPIVFRVIADPGAEVLSIELRRDDD
jgi:transcription elongation factor Elf1